MGKVCYSTTSIKYLLTSPRPIGELITTGKLLFQIILKNLKKADAKSGPDEGSGPDDKNRTDRTVRTLPFFFIYIIYIPTKYEEI